MDDLDALCPPAPAPWTLGGTDYPAKPLTLGRFAAARRFALAFTPVLAAEDMIDALERESPALFRLFEEATGVPAAALADAPLDEAEAALFRLARELRDFTTGPLAMAITAGVMPLITRQTAPAGEAGLPGLSDADTALPN